MSSDKEIVKSLFNQWEITNCNNSNEGILSCDTCIDNNTCGSKITFNTEHKVTKINTESLTRSSFSLEDSLNLFKLTELTTLQISAPLSNKKNNRKNPIRYRKFN